MTVMDDYSRFILAWKLQKDMSADSLIEVVQGAMDATGMTDVPVSAWRSAKAICSSVNRVFLMNTSLFTLPDY
jgi:hypothetical protein